MLLLNLINTMSSNNSYTTFVAWVGVGIGLISLFIHFYKVLLERPKLRILTSEQRFSYFLSLAEAKVPGYPCKYGIITSLVVNNCSVHPVTISSVFLKSKNIKKHHREFQFQFITIRTKENLSCSLPIEDILKLPLRIEPFDTVLFSCTFPYVDELINEEKLDDPITVKVHLDTPRKCYRHKIKIYEYKKTFWNLKSNAHNK